MSWRKGLRESSFRGVPFFYRESSKPVGRRLHVHQYPRRDETHAEDLGGVAKDWAYDAFVFGDDYMSQRDKLIDALNKEGPGEFIHPREGSFWVKAGLGSVSESTSEGGYAQFSLTFVYAGEQALQGSIKNTTVAVEQAAEVVMNAVTNELDTELDADSGLSSDAAVETLSFSMNDLKRINGGINERIANVSDIGSQIDEVGDDVAELIGQPAALVTAYSRVLFSLYGAYQGVAGAFNIYRDLDQSFVFVDVAPNTTPTNKIINANQALLSNSLRAMNTAVAAKAIAKLSFAVDASASESPFDNFSEVIAVRDSIISSLDEVSETVGYGLYEALKLLSVQFSEHLNNHGVRLPRIHHYKLKECRPWLAVAYELVGDASLAEELRVRNRLKQPLFIESGKLLEYMR